MLLYSPALLLGWGRAQQDGCLLGTAWYGTLSHAGDAAGAGTLPAAPSVRWHKGLTAYLRWAPVPAVRALACPQRAFHTAWLDTNPLNPQRLLTLAECHAPAHTTLSAHDLSDQPSCFASLTRSNLCPFHPAGLCQLGFCRQLQCTSSTSPLTVLSFSGSANWSLLLLVPTTAHAWLHQESYISETQQSHLACPTCILPQWQFLPELQCSSATGLSWPGQARHPDSTVTFSWSSGMHGR